MGSRSGSERRQLRKQLTVRVSEETYAAIKAQVDDAGAEFATWLREHFDTIAADCDAGPKRRRSKRGPLPIDVIAVKELAGHLGQLCGAIILMIGRERLPFSRIERGEVKSIHDDLLALKHRLVDLLRDLQK